jgi:hypothetical protein
MREHNAMKTILLSTLCALGTTSCEVLPTVVKKADGSSVVTGGGSIFTKSDSKWVRVKDPSGLSIEYASKKHDETVVPVKGIGSMTTIGVAKEINDGLKTTEATKTTLGAQSVSTNATNKAAASADLKTLNPVEEAIPAVIPTPQP